MATPNVDFYQRQKDFQNQISQSEQERLQLEKQLKLLLQSDQNSSQLKATKVHTYWKKICADEKRAQQRNSMLVREFERIDAHLSSVTARTQRLNFLKQQYADYVARTYPQWTRMVEDKMRGEPQQQQDAGSGAVDSGVRRSQEWTEAEKEDIISQHQLLQQQPQQTQPQQRPQQVQQRPQQQQPPPGDGAGAAGDGRGMASQPVQSHSAQRVSSPSKPSSVSNISAKSSTSVSANASKVTSVSAATTVQAKQQPPPQQQQQQQQRQQQQTQAQQQRVASPVKQPAGGSGRAESPMSDYVNISQFSNKQAVPAHAGQGDHRSMSPKDEDLSDFGSGSDLPLSGGDASPVKVSIKREEGTRSRTDSVRSLRSSGSLLPELTVDGLIRLLHHIETDLGSSKRDTEYYTSPILNPAEKIDLIQRANAGGVLQGLSGSTASNLVLEQMSHVIRDLPEECLIGEQLLSQPVANVTASKIGDSLTGEAQTLWIAVFTHFNRLHAASVMEAKEIAGVFVPCLVMEGSQQMDKAFALICNFLEADDATDASSIASPHPASPHHLGHSNSLMEDGRVPPLKFGSLVDKPLSDDESSWFDQSMPKEPAVPLNETSAYKQMLSGTLSRTPQKAPVTSDDTDDDVEKEFANVLSPKTTMTQAKEPSPRVVPHVASEPESMSEAEPSSPGPKSPVYVPTAVEQRSVFGSTMSSQGQKRAGLRLGSDFETDSEMEPAIFGSSKKTETEEDKDDFDFYD